MIRVVSRDLKFDLEDISVINVILTVHTQTYVLLKVLTINLSDKLRTCKSDAKAHSQEYENRLYVTN